MSNLLFAWLLVFLAGLNSTIGNLLLKKSREQEFLNFFDSLLNLWFFGGILFYIINVLLFVKALELLPVSQAYPVLAGFGFLLLTVSANVLLGESLNLNHYIGIAFIVFGIFLLSYSTNLF